MSPADIYGIPRSETWLWYIFNLAVHIVAMQKDAEDFASVRELIQ